MNTTTLDLGIRITYYWVLPVLVVLGVVGSVGSMWVLSQPALGKATGNRYFLALATCDLLLSVFYIPIVVTATGCSFVDYGSAVYFAHFGWTTACTFHALGTYILVFLSLDRFVGAWFPTWFKTLQQPPFGIWQRMAAMVVVCVGVHVPYMVDAKVVCWKPNSAKGNSTQTNTRECPDGQWISTDGFELSFNETWHQVYRHFYNLTVRWLPYGLLLVLNLSLVVAVSLGKVRLPGARGKQEAQVAGGSGTLRTGSRRSSRSSERILVATVIAMTASYVLLTLPITVFLSAFANTGSERCKSSTSTETLRHVGNVFQLLEHVLHAFFLVLIYPRFRRQLLHLLKCRKPPTGEGDTTTPDDSTIRPLSSASRSYSLSVRVRDSTVPQSCQPLRAHHLS